MPFEGQGVLAAVTTPLDSANRVDVALLAQHSADLLRRGLHGITLFGTTGEGQSFTVAERSAALEGLLGRGIGSGDLVVGAGAAALGDAISLARHALAQGCRRVLLVPPFYFKDVSSAGVVDAIGQVIDAVDDPGLRVILYHIPQVSAVSFDDESISTLRQRYGSVIDGIKDSSGNLDHSLALIRHHPGLNVYVGAEDTIGRARAAGGAGSICGLANIAPEQVRASFDSEQDPDAGVLKDLLRAVVGQPFVPFLKAWVATCQGNDGWRRVRAPLAAIDADVKTTLPRALLSGTTV